MRAAGHRWRVAAIPVVIAATAVQCGAPPVPEPAVSAPSSSAPAATTAPARVAAVDAAALGASWRPGCPVPPEQLRRVTVDYLGFDLATHRGELIVHRDVVDDIVAIFADLYRMDYPIERMHTVERYPGADDEASMRDNNTSAFNCRRIPGSGTWAQHAYGRAVDLNPLLNPSRSGDGTVEPANAAVYLDRTRIDPGLLHDGDPAVRAFTDRGWTWGGHWRSPVDYQHFERPAAGT
ncbi:M15 family metallopeptidase [Mycolicibacillus trivialis]|uniref:M15 family metallopeptidase n=2 Tax=Mycolicibacillus trivialis TaxID=1798 RepID=UPI0026BDCD5B